MPLIPNVPVPPRWMRGCGSWPTPPCQIRYSITNSTIADTIISAHRVPYPLRHHAPVYTHPAPAPPSSLFRMSRPDCNIRLLHVAPLDDAKEDYRTGRDHLIRQFDMLHSTLVRHCHPNVHPPSPNSSRRHLPTHSPTHAFFSLGTPRRSPPRIRRSTRSSVPRPTPPPRRSCWSSRRSMTWTFSSSGPLAARAPPVALRNAVDYNASHRYVLYLYI